MGQSVHPPPNGRRANEATENARAAGAAARRTTTAKVPLHTPPPPHLPQASGRRPPRPLTCSGRDATRTAATRPARPPAAGHVHLTVAVPAQNNQRRGRGRGRRCRPPSVGAKRVHRGERVAGRQGPASPLGGSAS